MVIRVLKAERSPVRFSSTYWKHVQNLVLFSHDSIKDIQTKGIITKGARDSLNVRKAAAQLT